VLPGSHVIDLEISRLPSGFAAGERATLTIALREDRPATGADFVVVAKTKPVIWRTIK